MSSQSPDPPWGERTTKSVALVRTMQIICGALLMGVICFAVIALFMRLGRGLAGPSAAKVVVAYLAAGMATVSVAARLFIPPQIVRSGIQELLKTRRVDDVTRFDLYPIYQTQMIVACALLEGAAIFNLIGFLVEGQIWTLAIVTALLAVMASAFPTLERVDSWADEQLRQLQMDPPRVN